MSEDGWRCREEKREIRCCYCEVGLWKGNSSMPINEQGRGAMRAGDKPT